MRAYSSPGCTCTDKSSQASMILISKGNSLSLIFQNNSRCSLNTFDNVCPLNSPSIIVLSPLG